MHLCLPALLPVVFVLIWLLWLTGRMNIYARINALQYLACKLRANSSIISNAITIYPSTPSTPSAHYHLMLNLHLHIHLRARTSFQNITSQWPRNKPLTCLEHQVPGTVKFFSCLGCRLADFAYDYMKFALHYFVSGPFSRCSLGSHVARHTNCTCNIYRATSSTLRYQYRWARRSTHFFGPSNWWSSRTRNCLLPINANGCSLLLSISLKSTKLLPCPQSSSRCSLLCFFTNRWIPNRLINKDEIVRWNAPINGKCKYGNIYHLKVDKLIKKIDNFHRFFFVSEFMKAIKWKCK